MNYELFYNLFGGVVLLAPALLLLLLGVASLVSRPLSEQHSAKISKVFVVAGLCAAVMVLLGMFTGGQRHVEVELGNWVALPNDHSGEHFHFHLKFVFDRLSVPFTILTFALVGTIGVFANRYLHRDRGFNRFFLLYALFLMGMVAAALAGTIETLFLGWELVGLSSALLVAYFHDRPSPVRNGQRVWAVYRVADAAFLIAAIALHHTTGVGDFAAMMGDGPWPYGQASMNPTAALVIGLLLLFAAAGKSALIPFSDWLPRAMEGPTPSSAVFYGALSVHLGAYLLLRVSPLLQLSLLLSAAVVVLGIASAVYAAVTARVQTDVKSALAFASLTQVGIITAEIGMGWNYLALVHMIGHAILRTLQLLRAPSLLHDYHTIENAIGEHIVPTTAGRIGGHAGWIYRAAFNRGSLDAVLDEYVVNPFLGAFRWCMAREQDWTDFLAGRRPHDAGAIDGQPASSGEEAA